MAPLATPASSLTQGEQRALASFIAGRLPAGQLHDELCRAREQALANAAAHQSVVQPDERPAAPPVPAFTAA